MVILTVLSQEQVAVVVGLLLRFFLAWYLPRLMDATAVPYTDVDYHVFVQAARRLQNGQSPYAKPSTYRYTPFLAALLTMLPYYETSGRFLFCLADTACGWIIVHMRRRRRRLRRNQPAPSVQEPQTIPPSQLSVVWHQHIQDVAWWLYNPLAINICTRGSAESLVVILPVLVTLQIATTPSTTTTITVALPTPLSNDTTATRASPSRGWLIWSCASLLAGLMHGVAIHAKLYPVIYTLSYAAYFATRLEQQQQPQQQRVEGVDKTITPQHHALWKIMTKWFYRLLSPLPIIFLGATIVSFGTLTYLAVVWYGNEALQEGIVYHLSRVDHRHNYSMFWYWIYLAKARAHSTMTRLAIESPLTTVSSSSSSSSSSLPGLGRVLLVPQAILLMVSSLGMAPHHLSLVLFVQTYLFVTLNKVITAQYFCWYLCLLPLCSDALQMTKRVQWALLYVALSVATWLGCAYGLEMLGLPFHRQVYWASVLFFIANINLLCAILNSFRTKQMMMTAGHPKLKLG